MVLLWSYSRRQRVVCLPKHPLSRTMKTVDKQLYQVRLHMSTLMRRGFGGSDLLIAAGGKTCPDQSTDVNPYSQPFLYRRLAASNPHRYAHRQTILQALMARQYALGCVDYSRLLYGGGKNTMRYRVRRVAPILCCSLCQDRAAKLAFKSRSPKAESIDLWQTLPI